MKRCDAVSFTVADIDTSISNADNQITVEELQQLQHKNESDIILHLQHRIHALENTIGGKSHGRDKSKHVNSPQPVVFLEKIK